MAWRWQTRPAEQWLRISFLCSLTTTECQSVIINHITYHLMNNELAELAELDASGWSFQRITKYWQLRLCNQIGIEKKHIWPSETTCISSVVKRNRATHVHCENRRYTIVYEPKKTWTREVRGLQFSASQCYWPCQSCSLHLKPAEFEKSHLVGDFNPSEKC